MKGMITFIYFIQFKKKKPFPHPRVTFSLELDCKKATNCHVCEAESSYEKN